MNFNNNNIIENLVISGGGPLGFSFFSCLEYLKQNNIWNIKNLKSIYATSVGTIISILLLFDFETEIIYDYFINRPWQDAFKLNAEILLQSFNNKGLFDENFFIIIFKPLFDTKNIDLNITLTQFFQLNKVNLFFYTFDLNNFETIELNHKNYPNLKLISAIKMSCSFPGIIMPNTDFLQEKCLIDGGILDNFPLNYCLRDLKEEQYNTILAINQENLDNIELTNNFNINNNSNIFDFFCAFFINSINYINFLKNKYEKFKYSEKNIENFKDFEKNIKIIYFKNKYSKINLWIDSLTKREFRKELIDYGIEIAKKYL